MSTVVNKAKFSLKYGSPSHQERVLKSNSTKTANVRWTHAIRDNTPKHHLDILAKDKDPEVRAAVATQGHPDHLQKLVKDKDPDVRKKVAMHSQEHANTLVSDPDEQVRAKAAEHCHPQHLPKLLADSSNLVKQFARWRHDAIKKIHAIDDPDGILKESLLARIRAQLKENA